MCCFNGCRLQLIQCEFTWPVFPNSRRPAILIRLWRVHWALVRIYTSWPSDNRNAVLPNFSRFTLFQLYGLLHLLSHKPKIVRISAWTDSWPHVNLFAEMNNHSARFRSDVWSARRFSQPSLVFWTEKIYKLVGTQIINDSGLAPIPCTGWNPFRTKEHFRTSWIQ